MKRRPLMIGAFTAGGVAASRGALAQAQSLTPIEVGYDGFSMTTAPMYFASKTGVFAKYGLDPTLIYIQGGSTLSQAGVGGSVDIAQNGYSPAAAAAIEGGNLVFIGGISNKLPFQLVVTAGIKNAADLKGKKIAISKYGSSTDVAATFALAHLGLTRQDVTVLQLGGEGTRTAALLSGQIDGSFEQYPRTAELEAQNCHILVDLTDIAGEYPNTAYVTTRAYLKTHPDLVKKFLMAIIEGIHNYKTNQAQALQLTAQFLKSTDPAAVKQAYDFYNSKVFPNIPWPSIKGIGLVIKHLAKTNPDAASVKPEQLVDLTPLQDLQKDGFLAKYQ